MNSSYETWVEEVKRSLKVEELPQFEKKISGGHGVSPFSVGRSDAFLQAAHVSHQPFLAIQNYTELVSGKLDAWISHPDVGLRFRQLQDIPQDDVLSQKSLFLSQPFLFTPNEEQTATLSFIEKSKAQINLGWSPLSFGLTRGEILKKPLKGLHSVVENEALRSQSTKWFYLSSAPYQWAGARPHAELGILLAVAYELLKELDACKMPLEAAIQKISFGLSLGTDVVVEPAKIIAMKLLFQKLIELLDSDLEFAVPPIYAMPSLRVYSGRQPWNNLIRSVLMCSSAMIGGAQGFKCIPYDVLNKNKNPNAIRESTNVPLLLRQEAHLQDVLNPLDGSPLFANAVDLLCSHAWDIFKEIEKKGGIFETVRTGWLQMELMRQSEFSMDQVKRLERSLIGVNEFVDKRFKYETVESDETSLIALENIIDPLFLDKTDDEYMSVQPLLITSLTQDWEDLQDQVARLKNKTITIVKVAGPGADKKYRLLTKTLDLVGAAHTTIDETKVSDTLKPGHVAVLIVSEAHTETQIATDIKTIGGIRMLSFFAGASSDTIHTLREDSTPFEVAEKIVLTLAGAQ